VYAFLAQFWYHIAITVLAVAIYLVTRLRGRRISADESIERAALSIAAGLVGAFMLGAAIIIAMRGADIIATDPALETFYDIRSRSCRAPHASARQSQTRGQTGRAR